MSQENSPRPSDVYDSMQELNKSPSQRDTQNDFITITKIGEIAVKASSNNRSDVDIVEAWNETEKNPFGI